MLAGAFLLLGSLPVTVLGGVVIFGSILVGSIFFGSLMLFIGAMVKSNNAYNSIQILIIFVVNFASTVFYPLSAGLPVVLRALFDINPLTYVADAVRGAYNGTLSATDGLQMLVLVAEMVVVLFLATRAYLRSDVSYE